MKIIISPAKSEQGSALIITLVVASLLGFALASYFKMVQFQNNAVVESQYWNSAIPLAEAGIEEALTHLNTVGDGDRASNGWSAATNQFTLTRTLGGGRYTVYIDNQLQPNIVSTGYAKIPKSGREVSRTVLVTTTRVSGGMKGLVAINDIVMVGNTAVDSFDSEDPNFSLNGRYVKARNKDGGYVGSVLGGISASGDGVWGQLGTGPNGWATGNAGSKAWMAANTGIEPGKYTKDLNVSFDDVAPPFSGGGFAPQYDQSVTVTNFNYITSTTNSAVAPIPPPADLQTAFQQLTTVAKPAIWSGTLATNTSATSATTAPASGTYIGNVTTRNVVEGNGNNRRTVTYYDYQRITSYTYNTTVYSWSLTSAQPTATTETYNMVFGTGNYQLSSVNVSGQGKILVQGNAVLYVTGDFQMAGQSQIIIATGASLKLYVAGGTTKLTGNGIMNLNQNATMFSYYGLPTNTSVHMGGNAAFTGTIYAPSADLQLGGGGNADYDVVGASVTKTVKLNGNFNFHYDERLGRLGGKAEFKVASWSEV